MCVVSMLVWCALVCVAVLCLCVYAGVWCRSMCVPCVMCLRSMSQSLSGSAGPSYAVAGGLCPCCWFAYVSMPSYLCAYLIVGVLYY